MIQEIKNRIIQGDSITKQEALKLANCNDKEAVYKIADEIREHFTGNSFELCTITNAKSGKCSENCKWCAQSAHFNTNVTEYEMIDKNEAIRQAKQNREYGVNKYSLVTSGKALSVKNLKKLCSVYNDIKKENDITLCASMGLLDKERLQMLKDAGIEHYHCNLETAPSYFKKLCTTHTFEQKIETIKNAQELGMGVCSGGIIGMGESMKHRIELAFELKKLNIKSIPINILNPIEGTPLQGTKKLTDAEILTTFAIFRLINPTAKIRFAGGRALISHIQEKALKSGINSALVGNLLTTLGTNVPEDIKAFAEAGFKVGAKSKAQIMN